MNLITQGLEILGCIAAAVTLPGSLELLLLTAGGLLPPRKTSAQSGVVPKPRPVFVVPAHDEQHQIAQCVHSLLGCSRGLVEAPVVVIADNCSDNTASVAEQAGATVLIRTDPRLRGKGHALNFAFKTLMEKGFDLFIVVDADTSASPNLLEEFVRAIGAGAGAVQCRYKVRNVGQSIRTRWMNIALMAFNVLRPRARDRFGLSAGLLGNGFGLTRTTLEKVPYDSVSIVEDLEYHLRLVRSGVRVHFLDSATVHADMPVTGKGVATQRSRWEGGRLKMLRDHSRQLGGEIIGGRIRLLEPWMELHLLPLAFHVLLLLLALVTPFSIVRIYAASSLALVALHLCAAIAVGGGDLRDVGALLSAPFYVIWKIRVIPQLVYNSRKNAAWVRTERNPTQEGAK